MPMIHTQRNYVMVGRALPQDRFVATFILRDSGRFLLTTQPIDRMPSAIRWAMDMADQMAGPIEVLPIESEEDLLRQIVIATAFNAMHACPDTDVRSEASELLAKIGVLKQ